MAKTRKVRSNKNVIGPLKKNELVNLGYSTKKSASARHRALNKSVKKYGALKTFRKLNAVATLNKNRAPSVSKVMLTDRNWVRKTHMKSTRKKGGKRVLGTMATGLRWSGRAARNAGTIASATGSMAQAGWQAASIANDARRGDGVDPEKLKKFGRHMTNAGRKGFKVAVGIVGPDIKRAAQRF